MSERTGTVAVMKTFGATTRYIILHFLIVVLILGFIGTLLGVLLGLTLQSLLPIVLGNVLPEIIEVSISEANTPSG